MGQQRQMEKQRELEEAGYSEPYARAMAVLAERDERARTGKVVIRQSDREWLTDRMAARCLYYLDHHYEDSANVDWRVFCHDIVTQSGGHRHQGGLALFVLEGRGATIMDGVRYDWEAGDLVLLPVKPDQVDHQHINLGGNAKWLAFIYSPMWQAVASTMVPTKDRPGWDS
ncbi:cupin domain-containing protein [Phytohabitans sp. ZYX-F-186]|nr:cupin domain-containing protein [Phytohabitans sp. ZYX-F-186]MDQ7909923.1 cupin domain-containing protein [Phytohabitans sp. ZYX-F-186]